MPPPAPPSPGAIAAQRAVEDPLWEFFVGKPAWQSQEGFFKEAIALNGDGVGAGATEVAGSEEPQADPPTEPPAELQAEPRESHTRGSRSRSHASHSRSRSKDGFQRRDRTPSPEVRSCSPASRSHVESQPCNAAARALAYNSSATVGVIKIVFESVMPGADPGQVADELFASPAPISVVQTYSARQLRDIESNIMSNDKQQPPYEMSTEMLVDSLVLIVARASSVSAISVAKREWGMSVRLRLMSPCMGQTNIKLAVVRRDVEMCTALRASTAVRAWDIVESAGMVSESAVADGIQREICDEEVRIICYTGDTGPGELLKHVRDSKCEINVAAWRPYLSQGLIRIFPMFILVAGPCKA
jgi:hypothetical protein